MERFAWMLLVLTTWGAATFLLKLVGVRMDNSSGALAIVVGYAIAGVAFGTLGGGRLGLSWAHAGAALIGALYIIGNWAFLRLAATEDVSKIAPLANLSVAIPIILGIILLGEPLTVKKLVGIAFALAAVVLLS